RKTVAVSDMKTVTSALKMYRLDNGDYPTTEQGLAALSIKPTAGPEAANWQEGGYLERAPKDPWGRPYIYKSPGREGAFELLSYGKDGKPGGDGLNADLVEGAH
ncbi:MAG: type II secretion system protein GspG, partial [Brevundimonas sp.]